MRTKKSHRPALAVATLAVASLVLAACAPTDATGGDASQATDGASSASAEPVDVGIIYSKTGPLAAYGEAYYEGFQAGLDHATGGTGEVDGRPINVTFHDDGGDPDKAVGQAKDLIGKGYQILGGTVVSGVALKLAEQAEQNKVLYISGPAAVDALTGINDYTFRSGRQSLQDVATAGTFLDPQGAEVVVFAQDNAFGQGNLAAVEAVLGAQGANVSSVLVPEDATEFTPFAHQIVDAAPDLVFVAWAGATSGAMWQGLDQQGVLDSTTVVTGLGDVATYGAYGAAASKVDFLNHYFPGAAGTEVEAAMLASVEAAGKQADLFTPDGFVAAQMIVHAIEEGGDDVDAMVDALEGWTFEGPKGTTTVRASDHALVQPMYQVRLVADGDAWVPELVAEVPGEDVAPAEAG
ncbi:substrate-binding domain-containing protein [Cellulosimicrobium composti]|uniref:ABC transporter substrate-binding protein n=1 Tax=Cellulosimicrobium composti TaxID=2672572 RepID=A0A6N7ZKU3_9MICO|nr:substrate-binding domain-containing protein [Cellulosimicrobium composti]MTG89903.1 ABC transporter substrate-binding protein [Cellulosimicrobium composti]NDO90687.1 ABC transporter substrate-binding protein [Cellulosimicrobium composti]TWG76945.1 branched-chain amino acid transport system substrate-binding protein [Cellulosimicrobium cellulans J34]SMF39626.1 amino acid/amide ABC transporter substrate-binding protein, HAAT family (TC 3.A.1.4.-) [Cellulosimicrobium cellulans J1]